MASKAEMPAQASFAQFILYFLKLGCIGFGGPIALVGYMQKDLVDELVRALAAMGPTDIREVHAAEENVTFTLPREVS